MLGLGDTIYPFFCFCFILVRLSYSLAYSAFSSPVLFSYLFLSLLYFSCVQSLIFR
jgi:hypothetical protein